MHEATARLLRYFEYEHLPAPLADVSRRFHGLAHVLAASGAEVDSVNGPVLGVELEGPELTVALRKLLEAKDAAVRAAL